MSDKGQKTVLALGEILWDLLPDGARLGGALFNFAARVNRLGDRAPMVSRLGRDALGDEALAAVRSLGLDTSLLQRDEVHPTGTVEVCFDEKGIPDYVIVPDVAYDYIEHEAVLDEAVAQADCFCFGTLVQRTEGTRKTLRHLLARAEDCLRVLDINLRKDCYSRETVEYSLGHADLLKLNDDEVRTLDKLLEVSCGDPAAFCTEIMARYPLEHCLVTFGEKGALVVSRMGETIYEPGYRVDVVDTLGSGDAFTAGFVHKSLHGATVRQVCCFGNVLGAMVAMQVGGTEPITPEAIARFERDGAERNVLPELEGFMVD
jgi:fructokinase